MSTREAFDIPFEDIFNDPRGFLERLGREARTHLLQALGLSRRAGSTVAVLDAGKRIEIVFSEKTAELIRTGKLSLPIDRTTRLLRVDARDTQHRIRELGKVRQTASAPRVALNACVAAAHLISAVDLHAQLQEVNEKVGDLLTFVYADRLGELRGLYDHLRKLVHQTASPKRSRQLADLEAELDRLAGRFQQTALAKLRGIKDPSDIGVIDALFTSQGRAESRLREDLSQALGDLRALEFTWMLLAIVLAELRSADAWQRQQLIVAEHIRALESLLVERASYLDFELRDKVGDAVKLLKERYANTAPTEVFLCESIPAPSASPTI
jgi:hypothetical protein